MELFLYNNSKKQILFLYLKSLLIILVENKPLKLWLKTINNNLNIIVKPNPANDNIFVSVSCKDVELFNAELRNAIGQVVYTGMLNCNKENRIKIQQLKQGIYSLIIKTREGSNSYKIVIIR